MTDHYILVGQTPVPIEVDVHTPEGLKGLYEWGHWFEHADRHVAHSFLWAGFCEVSTIFLGLDHAYWVSGEPYQPILFETMSFWSNRRVQPHQERCATWLEAEEQHRQIVRECRRPLVALRAFGEAWLDEWNDLVWLVKREWRQRRGTRLTENAAMLERMRSLAFRHKEFSLLPKTVGALLTVAAVAALWFLYRRG